MSAPQPECLEDLVSLPAAFITDLGAAGSVEEILDTVATWLPSIVRADRASVALATPNGDGLEVFAMGGSHAIALGSLLPIEGTLLGRVFRERRLIHFRDHTDSPAADARLLVEAGLRSCMNAPLLSAGECFGTLNLAHAEPDHFDPEAERLLSALGWLLGSSIRVHRQMAAMEVLANTDPLTEVMNRRAFGRAGSGVWERFARHNQPFTLLLLDLDNFKAINDRHGYGAGDAVLRSVSGDLRQSIRASDVVARIGGEEFAVILSGVTPESGRSWAESLRKRIASCTVSTDSDPIRYTTSIGMAVARRGDKSFEAVYGRADRALYTAKAEGRDRVVLAGV